MSKRSPVDCSKSSSSATALLEVTGLLCLRALLTLDQPSGRCSSVGGFTVFALALCSWAEMLLCLGRLCHLRVDLPLCLSQTVRVKFYGRPQEEFLKCVLEGLVEERTVCHSALFGFVLNSSLC